MIEFELVITVPEKEFEQIIAKAVGGVPEPYKSRLENIAFIAEEEVLPEQARKLNLAPNVLLFGLYEGVPPVARNTAAKLLPDKITIYKKPHELVSQNLKDFKAKVGHTVWHEVGHYFGLSDAQIHALDGR